MNIIFLSFLMAFLQTIMFDLLTLNQLWKTKKRFYIGFLIFAIYFICCMIKLPAQGRQDIHGGYIVLISYIFAFLVYKWMGCQARDILALFCAMLCLGLVGDLVSFGVMFNILGYSQIPVPREMDGVIPMIISYAVQLFLIICAHFLRKRHLFSSQMIQFYGKISISVMVAQSFNILFAMVILKFRNQQSLFIPMLFTMETIFAACLLYVFYMRYRCDDIQQTQRQLSLLEEEAQQNYKCYKHLETRYQHLYKSKHDFNNILNTAYIISQNGDYQKAKNLLESLNKTLRMDHYEN